jgi:hypothetical protein
VLVDVPTTVLALARVAARWVVEFRAQSLHLAT